MRITFLLLLSYVQSFAMVQDKNTEEIMTYFGSLKTCYNKEKQSIDNFLENSIHPISINNREGSILWSYENSEFLNNDVLTCDNDSYVFAGIHDIEIVIFQLFNTLGNGVHEWVFNSPLKPDWSQVDASKKAGIIVGLAVSDFSTP